MGEGLLGWAQNQKVELAQRRKAAEAYPKSRRTFMGSLKEDLDYFAKEMDKIEEGTRKHPDQVNETWFEAPYFLDDNVEVPPPGKAWKEGSVHLRPLSAAERKTHRVTGPHFFYFDDPENRFDPFQGKYPRFDPDHETPMSRAEALREAGSLQKEGLEWVDSIIETDIGWEEEKLGEVVAFAKKFASKPAKKDMESAYIDFDFTGWRYLGGLDPDLAKQRLQDKMGDPKARLALSVRYVPFPDNRLGEWAVSGWWLKVYSREFSSEVDQMKENVREVARTTRHEMQHFAQDALRVIKLLSEEAGLPRRRVRHLEDVGAGGEPLSPLRPRGPWKRGTPESSMSFGTWSSSPASPTRSTPSSPSST